MTKKRHGFVFALCCALVVFLSAGAHAEQIFQTTLELKEPATAAGIDRVEFVWSTDAEGKRTGGNELSGLAVALYAGDSLIYTDLAISEWLLLPVMSEAGLTERSREDIFWDFDLENLILRQFRSILPKNLKGSVGEHYQVADGLTLPKDGKIHIRHFVDGEIKERKAGDLLRQSTRLLKSFDPLPVAAEEVEIENVETLAVESPTEAQAEGPDQESGSLASFVPTTWGLYVAELAAFGIEEGEMSGVRVNGEARPVFVEEGVLRFFLGEDDLGAAVEIGRWDDAVSMEIVDAAPVSVDGDVGFATAGDGATDRPVGEGVSRYLVSGIQGNEVWLLDVSNPARPRWMTQQAVFESEDGIGVYFETGVTEVRRLFVLPPHEAFELLVEE